MFCAKKKKKRKKEEKRRKPGNAAAMEADNPWGLITVVQHW